MARHSATASTAGGSYGAGERGRNRVRLYRDPVRGLLYLEYRERGRRERVATGTRDFDRGKAMADELAGRLARQEPARPNEPPTLATLFDNYLRDVTPTKTPGKQAHDRRAAAMFAQILGPATRADRLTPASARRFIAERQRRGDQRLHRRARGIRMRVIQYDLGFLRAVLRWAVGEGRLERNPLEGYRLPRETSPRRPLLSEEEYGKMVGVAERVSPTFGPLLAVAHETGHRLSALLALRWSDIDRRERVVTWRRESDKQGHEHTTPLTTAAVGALEALRGLYAAIGDAPVFPAPSAPDRPVDRHTAIAWWLRAEVLSELPHVEGRGWHSLRRTFATELLDQPLKVLAQLGGWTDTRTLLECYQHPGITEQRAALAERKSLARTG